MFLAVLDDRHPADVDADAGIEFQCITARRGFGPFEIKKIVKDEKGKPVYEWDFTRFNPAYFAHVEACVDKLAGIGVEIGRAHV